jgi:hypothetical protein
MSLELDSLVQKAGLTRIAQTPGRLSLEEPVILYLLFDRYPYMRVRHHWTFDEFYSQFAKGSGVQNRVAIVATHEWQLLGWPVLALIRNRGS